MSSFHGATLTQAEAGWLEELSVPFSIVTGEAIEAHSNIRCRHVMLFDTMNFRRTL